jgi:hypothetical protein
MDDSVRKKYNLIECITTPLGFCGNGDPVLVIKSEIAKRHAITDIELSFKDDKSEITITATAENGNLFSRCVMCNDDPTDINLKFWDALEECENFMAGEYLRW